MQADVVQKPFCRNGVALTSRQDQDLRQPGRGRNPGREHGGAFRTPLVRVLVDRQAEQRAAEQRHDVLGRERAGHPVTEKVAHDAAAGRVEEDAQDGDEARELGAPLGLRGVRAAGGASAATEPAGVHDGQAGDDANVERESGVHQGAQAVRDACQVGAHGHRQAEEGPDVGVRLLPGEPRQRRGGAPDPGDQPVEQLRLRPSAEGREEGRRRSQHEGLRRRPDGGLRQEAAAQDVAGAEEAAEAEVEALRRLPQLLLERRGLGLRGSPVLSQALRERLPQILVEQQGPGRPGLVVVQ
mmetsp:Transcript_32127/g.69991  ORF Transcript_32127/g.69991 Transcript_32127/m.69991 type:complete len:298 (+) Transcript_32127:76-969(+)